jgi:hypothetical protein
MRLTGHRGALLNVRQAMLNAGFADSMRSWCRPTRRRSLAGPVSATRVRLHPAVDRWLRDLEQNADWANDTAVPINGAVRNGTPNPV